MDELIIKEFNDNEIVTLILNNKVCWIAKDIAKVLGYENQSKAVNQCINSEKFECGIEYDVLSGDKLREVKKLIGVTHMSGLKQIPKLVIFYEEGLYGFINYSELPIGISFRKWLRREVLIELKKKDLYHEENDFYPKDKIDKLIDIDNLKKRSDISSVLEALRLIDRIISNDYSDKLRDIKDLLY